MIEPIRLPFPVYYCRHGETDWNKAQRLQGHADIPLNETGRKQARGYGKALARREVDWSGVAFYSSPLGRATETLELVLEELDLAGADRRTDERLIELNLGEWCGMKIEDVQKQYPDEWAIRKETLWTSPVPGDGETYAGAEKRLRAFAESLTGPSLIVGHGGTGRVFRGLLTHGDPTRFLKHGTRQTCVYILEDGQERMVPSW